MSFNIGDRVVYSLANGSTHRLGWHRDLDGVVGTVLVNSSINIICVEFNIEFDGGHSCGERGKPRQCLYVDPCFLSLIATTNYELEEML